MSPPDAAATCASSISGALWADWTAGSGASLARSSGLRPPAWSAGSRARSLLPLRGRSVLVVRSVVGLQQCPANRRPRNVYATTEPLAKRWTAFAPAPDSECLQRHPESLLLGEECYGVYSDDG